MVQLNFKNLEVLYEALHVPWHIILIDIYAWILERVNSVTITSAFRWDSEGVHNTNPLRAFDLRSHDMPDPEKLHDDMNKFWVYDPARPHMRVCVLHAICPKCKTNHDVLNGIVNVCVSCGTDITSHWHFHVQCSNSTTDNKGGQK